MKLTEKEQEQIEKLTGLSIFGHCIKAMDPNKVKKIIKNQKIVDRIKRKIKKLEKQMQEHPGRGMWYLREWKKIMGESKIDT